MQPRRDNNGPPPDLWGGLECTVNRVGDRYFDQVVRTGHQDRMGDLDRIAALGIRTLRYPVIWERITPDDPDGFDWTWTDARLQRLRELGIRPIVGLCHHGSGPRWTGLLDPAFPAHLARFARAVAERYPWVDAYTPVNEPLTTARFAALYGHWHPHATDEREMIRALLHQVRAVQLAMREIRHVNPDAHLVQTEDLARVWSTAPLRYQAEYENERRWLSLDMLTGRLDRHHPLWGHVLWLGLSDRDIDPLRADAYDPDVIGGNYYITSERFLDHRLECYPPQTHGGNGRDAYADVEAVRVRRDSIAGPATLLRETWERYGRPVAITEAHLGASPGEQVRWLTNVWRDAVALCREGINVPAVTIWSLFGSWDWPSLCTRLDDYYEPGAFDARESPPRPTRLAAFAASLAAGKERHLGLAEPPGWWESPERLLYPPVDGEGHDIEPSPDEELWPWQREPPRRCIRSVG